MQLLIELITLFGVFTLLFLSPACMNIGLVRVSTDSYKVTTTERLLCCIPVFNHFYGWYKYSGKKTSLAGISSVILLLTFVIRTAAMFYFFDNASLQLTTVYIFLAAIVLFWIMNAINIYMVLSDSGAYTMASRVVNAITVVIGQITVGYYMPRKMHYYSTKNKKGNLYGRN